MAKKRKSSLFWRIAISMTGAALILIAVVSLMLFFFGKSTTATVTTRRMGGSDDNYAPSIRYQWSVDYTFTSEGKTYSGHSTKRGSDLSVKTDNTVYYFPFAPYINSLESTARPNIGQLIMVIIGIFLIYVMNVKKKKRRSKRKAA